MAKRAKHEPRPELVITDVKQLRAISDPLRIRIIEAMAELPLRGWTAKELAQQLRTSQTKLYHHLSLLDQRGIIEVAETRMVSGILEKRYRVTAVSFRVDRSLFGSGGLDAVADVLDVIFDKARTEILAGQRAGIVDLTAEEHEQRRMRLSASHVRLSPASVRRVQRLVERLAAVDDLEERDGTDYGLIVAFYPRAPEMESDR